MKDETKVKAWVQCECGEEHRLFPGIDKPCYWCGDELKTLKPGDDIVYEETPGGFVPSPRD